MSKSKHSRNDLGHQVRRIASKTEKLEAKRMRRALSVQDISFLDGDELEDQDISHLPEDDKYVQEVE